MSGGTANDAKPSNARLTSCSVRTLASRPEPLAYLRDLRFGLRRLLFAEHAFELGLELVDRAGRDLLHHALGGDLGLELHVVRDLLDQQRDRRRRAARELAQQLERGLVIGRRLHAQAVQEVLPLLDVAP